MEYITNTQFALGYIKRKFKEQIEQRKRFVKKDFITEEYLKQRGNVILGREDFEVEKYYLCYNSIYVIAPFKLIDIVSFMQKTDKISIKDNLEQLRKRLKKLYDIACENIEIYENSLFQLLENDEIPSEILRQEIIDYKIWTILKGGIKEFDENNTRQRYDNDKFYAFCYGIKGYLEEVIFEKTKTVNKPPVASFESTLTEPQLKTLFAELISNENKFIHPDTTPEQFIAVFRAEVIENINRVKWIDIPDKNKASINAKTLFELLYLLKEKDLINKDDFDTNPHNKSNFYKKINLCFSDITGKDIKDIKSKCPTKAEKNTERKIKLAEILANSIK
jgi:hypothetical protein